MQIFKMDCDKEVVMYCPLPDKIDTKKDTKVE